MKITFDRTKTLEQLDPSNWDEPDYDSHLVSTAHRLRHKPLGEFTSEDLRLMIGQSIGLDYLIPLAIERLIEDPLSTGDFYRGDLLKQVLSVEQEFWKAHTKLYWEVEEIISELENIKKTIENQLMPAVKCFKGSNSNC